METGQLWLMQMKNSLEASFEEGCSKAAPASNDK